LQPVARGYSFYLEERLIYLRELNSRRDTILESITTQDKLTPALEQAIIEADTKTEMLV
jgi:uncharacterized protein